MTTEIRRKPDERYFMNHSTNFFPGRRTSACLALLAPLLLVLNTQAQVQNMTSGDATISINTSSPAGMNSWTVDGQNQLNQQWFYYSIGSGSVAQGIQTISAPSTATQTDPSKLDTTYANSGLSVRAVYTLSGGAFGSGTSGLIEQLTIQNLSASAITLHFFEYADFSMGANNNNVQLASTLAGYNEALVTSGNLALSESIDTGLSPRANHGEAALFNNTLTSITTVPGYVLNDQHLAGPGHSTWAFEWDATLAANTGTLIISKTLSITNAPEPATWALVSVGLVGFGFMRRFSARGK
ncbi:MAG: hypothetical protein JWR26_703 [Pedosphaera sp.]|nr:hypothetical protein [Pedosphaera sp.]